MMMSVIGYGGGCITGFPWEGSAGNLHAWFELHRGNFGMRRYRVRKKYNVIAANDLPRDIASLWGEICLKQH
jgi:hypothetical protein